MPFKYPPHLIKALAGYYPQVFVTFHNRRSPSAGKRASLAVDFAHYLVVETNTLEGHVTNLEGQSFEFGVFILMILVLAKLISIFIFTFYSLALPN